MALNLRKPLTKKGHTRLADEHERLARVERPRVVEGIATAAAEGDRSENAEYIYGKKRLRELDKRLRYLNSLLQGAQIIDPDQIHGERKIAFGASVFVEDENSRELVWHIVGEGEADYKRGEISWLSPVAKALQGKAVGDVLVIQRPAGPLEVTVRNIRYGKNPWLQEDTPNAQVLDAQKEEAPT